MSNETFDYREYLHGGRESIPQTTDAERERIHDAVESFIYPSHVATLHIYADCPAVEAAGVATDDPPTRPSAVFPPGSKDLCTKCVQRWRGETDE